MKIMREKKKAKWWNDNDREKRSKFASMKHLRIQRTERYAEPKPKPKPASEVKVSRNNAPLIYDSI